MILLSENVKHLTWWWPCSCPCSKYWGVSFHSFSAECHWTLCSWITGQSVYTVTLPVSYFLYCEKHKHDKKLLLEKKNPAHHLELSKAFFNRAYLSHLNSKYTSNNSKPTRSQRFSVPATSMNIFIVSKATQYLAINLPTSEQSKSAWMKWSVMLSNEDNMKQQYLNWSSFNLLAWCWYLCPFGSSQLKIRRLSSADTILWEQTRRFFAQTTK